MKHFVRAGWYALRYRHDGERITAYKEFDTDKALQDTIDNWTGMGYLITQVDFISDPSVIRVNGLPLVPKGK